MTALLICALAWFWAAGTVMAYHFLARDGIGPTARILGAPAWPVMIPLTAALLYLAARGRPRP